MPVDDGFGLQRNHYSAAHPLAKIASYLGVNDENAQQYCIELLHRLLELVHPGDNIEVVRDGRKILTIHSWMLYGVDAVILSNPKPINVHEQPMHIRFAKALDLLQFHYTEPELWEDIRSQAVRVGLMWVSTLLQTDTLVFVHRRHWWLPRRIHQHARSLLLYPLQ